MHLNECFDNVRSTTPLVHNITNYVTVHDVANVIIAAGGSPIMSDEPEDVEDITSICGALNVNIGTLNQSSIQAMVRATARAQELGHPMVLDPVGAGASKLRTATARNLMAQRRFTCIRGNMSEIKALVGVDIASRGVDVAAADVVTYQNLRTMAGIVGTLAREAGSIIAVSGAIDLISDGERTCAVSNGHPMMAHITGSGCMLSGIVAAYLAANPDHHLDAVVTAFAMYGLAGKFAAERAIAEGVGNATYSNYLIDAVDQMDAKTLVKGAIIEEL